MTSSLLFEAIDRPINNRRDNEDERGIMIGKEGPQMHKDKGKKAVGEK